ncbi:MAG TPA: TVP38/TMEM64 family protein [Thermoanaerobaculia bacterium]|nr:TVP38/TMEM64 family protein [Thermoanaerobaculia bacterium]
MTSRTWIKIVVLLVIAAAVAVVFFSPLRHQLTFAKARDWVHQEREHVRGVWYAPVIMVSAYAIGCVVVVPATLFIVPAGAIWGWKLGSVYAMCGAMLGASASYFVGRFLGHGILDKFGKAGQIVARQVDHAGFHTMLIVRLIPGPPFAVWNYGAGVAGVRFRDYFFGTLIGTLPAHVVFAYSADALFSGKMTEGQALRQLIILAALLLTLVLIPTIVKKYMRRGNGTAAGMSDDAPS